MNNTRAFLGWLIAAALIILLVAASDPLYAQIGVCNPPVGTVGRTKAGDYVACTPNGTNRCADLMLGEGDVWLPCKPPASPEPQGCPMLPTQTWAEGPNSCKPDTVLIGPNGLVILKDTISRDGATGHLAMRCAGSRWVETGRRCVDTRSPKPPAKPASSPKPRRSGDAQVGPIQIKPGPTK
jgi:hypothetical protein